MKKISLPILFFLVSSFAIAGCTFPAKLSGKREPDQVLYTYEDCANSGGMIQESYPEKCLIDGQTFTKVYPDQPITNFVTPESDDETIPSPTLADQDSTKDKIITGSTSIHKCTEEERLAEVCTMDYRPVCGNDGVTYSNGCMACGAKVNSWTEGECDKTPPYKL